MESVPLTFEVTVAQAGKTAQMNQYFEQFLNDLNDEIINDKTKYCTL